MLDTPEELLAKIRLGEDTSLELKSVQFRGDRVSAPKREALADEIAAIANTHDGALVLGVDDKSREILGVPVERLEALERYVFEICSDSIRPSVQFRSFRMELPDGTGRSRAVLRLEIPRSLFVHESPGGYYQQQGSSARKMSPEVLARLFQQRSQARLIRFDSCCGGLCRSGRPCVGESSGRLFRLSEWNSGWRPESSGAATWPAAGSVSPASRSSTQGFCVRVQHLR